VWQLDLRSGDYRPNRAVPAPIHTRGQDVDIQRLAAKSGWTISDVLEVSPLSRCFIEIRHKKLCKSRAMKALHELALERFEQAEFMLGLLRLLLAI
jgi:hypothetical protein